MPKLKVKADPAEAFLELLESCYQQTREDPSGVLANHRLYDALHNIYLQLCHGDIRQAEADRE